MSRSISFYVGPYAMWADVGRSETEFEDLWSYGGLDDEAKVEPGEPPQRAIFYAIDGLRPRGHRPPTAAERVRVHRLGFPRRGPGSGGRGVPPGVQARTGDVGRRDRQATNLSLGRGLRLRVTRVEPGTEPIPNDTRPQLQTLPELRGRIADADAAEDCSFRSTHLSTNTRSDRPANRRYLETQPMEQQAVASSG